MATRSNGGAATPRPVAQTPGGAPGAAATPATVQRGSVEGVPQLRIPFRAEKKGKSGRADGTRGKGKGVVRAATPASALRSTQDNTVLVADVLQRLAVQGTRVSTFRWILQTIDWRRWPSRTPAAQKSSWTRSRLWGSAGVGPVASPKTP